MTCTICGTHNDRGHACHHCEAHAREWLTTLPAWYATAAHLLQPATGAGTPVTGGERGLGVNLAALDIRHGSDWITVLHSWWRLVEEERHLTVAPLHHGDTAATLQWHVDALNRHLPWVYETRPWAADFHTELRQMWARGRAICEGPPPKGVSVECPTDGCGRRIPITDADAVVKCRYCGVERPAASLGRAASEVWVDVEAASVATGVPTRTLERWAQRGHVRRKGGRYLLEDIATRVAGASGSP